jgi:hypothetical protein
MVRYTFEQRVFLCDTYVKYGSAGKCRRKFRPKVRNERVPIRQTIHKLVNKLRTTGLLIDKKRKHKRRVLTEEGARLEHTPRISLKRLAQETGVSESVQERQHIAETNSNPNLRTPCSHAIQLAGFIFAVGFYSLSSKVRSIRN